MLAGQLRAHPWSWHINLQWPHTTAWDIFGEVTYDYTMSCTLIYQQQHRNQ